MWGGFGVWLLRKERSRSSSSSGTEPGMEARRGILSAEQRVGRPRAEPERGREEKQRQRMGGWREGKRIEREQRERMRLSKAKAELRGQVGSENQESV